MTETVDISELTADEARARFEELVPQIRNQEIVEQCAMLLTRIVGGGGIVVERDWQRLYGHLGSFEAQMNALTNDVLLSDVRKFAKHTAEEIVARRDSTGT